MLITSTLCVESSTGVAAIERRRVIATLARPCRHSTTCESSTSPGCSRARSARCSWRTSAPTSSRSRTPPAATTCAGCRRSSASTRRCSTRINRNKRSLAIDLKNPLGREAFLRLADDAPTSSWRASAPASWTASASASTRSTSVNPRIVLCSISGYGQDGPFRDRAGHDLNYAAVAGVLLLGGTVDGAPAMPGLQVGDLGGGALDAALAIMVALHHAARTGEGQHCDISMVDGLISWTGVHASQLFATGDRTGARRRHAHRALSLLPDLPVRGRVPRRSARSSRSSGASSSR